MADTRPRRRLDQPRSGRRFSFDVDPETFGRLSESLARFMGTGTFLFWQTLIVIIWISLNLFAVSYQWDPYPFILLNLAFSTQAAYAAPLILLAETRQTDRDKREADRVDKRHTKLEEAARTRTQAIKAETDRLAQLLEANTALTQQDKELTEQVATLTREIHALLTKTA
jgi:uncharacterized membrane protein